MIFGKAFAEKFAKALEDNAEQLEGALHTTTTPPERLATVALTLRVIANVIRQVTE